MKPINQKPQSPSKTSIFQTGALKNRNQSPVPFIKPLTKTSDKSIILDESMNQWKQTTEIQIKNSFQTDSNMKESIEQLVQQITLKLKQQEAEQFIKELNSPLLASDPSAALYQAPLDKGNQDFMTKFCSHEIKKAKALKQFMANFAEIQSVNQSVNSSFSVQQTKNSKVKQTAGSPQKFQIKQVECQCVDQKVITNLQQQIKTQEQIIAQNHQSLIVFQEQQRKLFSELQIQVSVQASKILQLESLINNTQPQEKKPDDQTTNQEVQRQLQLVMRNLNSLAEHQQQQMMILKTALTNELKNDFLCTQDYNLTQQEMQTSIELLKESVKQTQQQSQDILIRKQQMIENLNQEIKTLMHVNSEKNQEIESLKLQNDAIIMQINQNKDEMTKHNQYIVELFSILKIKPNND